MKKKIKILLLFILPMLLFVACDTTDEEEKVAKQLQEERYFDLYMSSTYKDTIDPPRESGLYYIDFAEGDGASPGAEDWLYLNYVGYTIPGDFVVDTYIENVVISSGFYDEVGGAALFGRFKMQNGSGPDGLTEGLTMMKVGGKAILCFKSDLAYGELGTTLMRSVAGYQSMKYEVELLEVIGEDIEAYEDAKFHAYVDNIVGVDTTVIADTIHDPTTDSYMYYIVDEAMPDSALVVMDTAVAVTYKGYLTDGRVFDENLEGDPLTFTMEANAVINGWILGLQRFREGEKGRLIIPYTLAYGEDGNMSNGVVGIPPYETLVFEIEVRDLAATEEEIEKLR